MVNTIKSCQLPGKSYLLHWDSGSKKGLILKTVFDLGQLLVPLPFGKIKYLQLLKYALKANGLRGVPFLGHFLKMRKRATLIGRELGKQVIGANGILLHEVNLIGHSLGALIIFEAFKCLLSFLIGEKE